jgi:hypothetical protein
MLRRAPASLSSFITSSNVEYTQLSSSASFATPGAAVSPSENQWVEFSTWSTNLRDLVHKGSGTLTTPFLVVALDFTIEPFKHDPAFTAPHVIIPAILVCICIMALLNRFVKPTMAFAPMTDADALERGITVPGEDQTPATPTSGHSGRIRLHHHGILECSNWNVVARSFAHHFVNDFTTACIIVILTTAVEPYRNDPTLTARSLAIPALVFMSFTARIVNHTSKTRKAYVKQSITASGVTKVVTTTSSSSSLHCDYIL